MGASIKDMFVDFFSVRFFENGGKTVIGQYARFSTLFVISVMVWLLELFVFKGPVFDPDTKSYLDAMEVNSRGLVDSFRMPGYPLLLVGFKWIFGEAYQWCMVIFQEVIFLISSVFLWDVARRFIGSVSWANLIGVVYIIFPVLMHYDYACILIPESILVSAVVVMLWLCVRCYQERMLICGGEWCYPLCITFNLLWLISLKPVFIYMILVLAIYWGYFLFCKRKRTFKQAVLGFVGLVIVIVGVLSYKREIKNLYGFDSISVVTIVNNYFFVRVHRVLDTSLIRNPDLKRTVDEYIENHGTDIDSIWQERGILFGLDEKTIEMQYVIDESIKKSPRKSLGGLYNRIGLVARCQMFRGLMDDHIYNPNRRHILVDDYLGGVYTIVLPTFNFLNYFLAAYVVLLLWKWRHSRKPVFMEVFLLLFIVAGYLVPIIGAMSDWARLTVQIFPAILLLIIAVR